MSGDSSVCLELSIISVEATKSEIERPIIACVRASVFYSTHYIDDLLPYAQFTIRGPATQGCGQVFRANVFVTTHFVGKFFVEFIPDLLFHILRELVRLDPHDIL